MYSRERDGRFADTGSLLTIHNLGHQGVFPEGRLQTPAAGPGAFRDGRIRGRRHLNLLQAGLVNADILTTVSPTYAEEIQTPEFGCGLDGLLRRREADLVGVLNGMDYEIWDPETDLHIPANYSHRTARPARQTNKAALQEAAGARSGPGRPGRRDGQPVGGTEGIRRALCGPTHGSLYSICDDLELQFVILGTGEAWCEDELTVLARKLPNLSVNLQFNDPLAHLIEAGADFFLMPSVYEPCGLSQMYSLRYGTLPIVRRTGGLADTVENYDQETGGGTGFVFDLLTPRAIYDTVGWAVWAWYNRPEHILEPCAGGRCR